MALKSDREIFEIAKETEHVTFQTTTRKTQSGYDLPMVVHDRLAFTPEEYIRRYNTIQTAMAEAELDALLVRGPENITYLSGYETPGYYKYHCIVVPKVSILGETGALPLNRMRNDNSWAFIIT